MNKCFFQIWEESSNDGSILTSGCTIHLTKEDAKSYLESIYTNRNSKVPKKYERSVGECIDTFVSDNLFERLKIKKNIKLSEVEKNNLIDLEEILFKPNI